METTVINSLSSSQIETLHQMYQKQWWSLDRKHADIKNLLAHSSLIIALESNEDHSLVAFSRIQTDFNYIAIIYDVIVHEDYRDQGFGKLLIDTIMDYPALKQVDYLDLYCKPDMVPFYNKWGFDLPSVGTVMLRKER